MKTIYAHFVLCFKKLRNKRDKKYKLKKILLSLPSFIKARISVECNNYSQSKQPTIWECFLTIELKKTCKFVK